MKLLRTLWQSSRLRLIFAALANVTTAALNAVLLALVQTTVRTHTVHTAWTYCALAAAIVLCDHVAGRLVGSLAVRLVGALREDLSRRLAVMPLRRLEAIGRTPAYLALTTQAHRVAEGAFALVELMSAGALFVGALAFVLWTSPVFFALCFLTFALAGVYVALHLRSVRPRLAQLYEASRGVFTELAAVVDGAKELRLNARRRDVFLDEHLGRAGARHYDVRRALLGADLGVQAVLKGGAWLLVGIAVFAVPRLAPASSAAAAGTVFALFYLVNPLAVIVTSIEGLAGASHALGTIEALDAKVAAGSRGAAPPSFADAIRMQSVTYRYSDEHSGDVFSVGPLDLEVRKGELVFLVGGNASGKTTVAKLLCGLYAPDAGTLSVDGVPVVDAGAYRHLFAAIFAEYHVFPGVVRAEDRALAQQLIGEFGLERVARLEGDTVVAGGVSTGQRKRLALLSAFLEDRPIYLFDEWAADQDPVFKRVFYETLLPELKRRGKTCIVITHDDHFFAAADRVVHLENGVVRR